MPLSKEQIQAAINEAEGELAPVQQEESRLSAELYAVEKRRRELNSLLSNLHYILNLSVTAS
jgi:hypothetical protein